MMIIALHKIDTMKYNDRDEYETRNVENNEECGHGKQSFAK